MVEAADLHLPIGKPVKVLLRSIDVLHDFYVPEFRAKMDMIPGSVTYFWFTPTQDRNLRGPVRRTVRRRAIASCAASSWSTPSEDYQAWLQQQSTFAQLSAPQQVGSAEADPADERGGGIAGISA